MRQDFAEECYHQESFATMAIHKSMQNRQRQNRLHLINIFVPQAQITIRATPMQHLEVQEDTPAPRMIMVLFGAKSTMTKFLV
jgi:hypothetical protein